MAYLALVFVHVLSAIVALGFNLTYPAWMALGAMSREHVGFALRGIKFVDDRIANPAYIVLLLTGGALVHFSGRSFTQPWILAALILYAAVAIVGILLFSPALENLITILDRQGPDSKAYAKANVRQTALGALTTVLALAILGLMILKPGGA